MSTNSLSAINASIVNLSVNTLYIDGIKYTIPTSLNDNISLTKLSATNASIVNLSVTNIYRYNTIYPILSPYSNGYISTLNLNTYAYTGTGTAQLRVLTLNSGVWLLKGHVIFSKSPNTVNYIVKICISNTTNWDDTNTVQQMVSGNLSVSINCISIVTLTYSTTSYYLLGKSHLTDGTMVSSSLTNIVFTALRIA